MSLHFLQAIQRLWASASNDFNLLSSEGAKCLELLWSGQSHWFLHSSSRGFHVVDLLNSKQFKEGAKCLGRLHNVQSCWFRLLSTFRDCSTVALLLSSECSRRGPLFSEILQVSIFCQIRCLGPTLGAKVCHLYYYSSGFNKVTLQSTHWSIQTLPISGGDSSCSWVFYSCTGPKCGVGVDLVDCNAVGGVAT